MPPKMTIVPTIDLNTKPPARSAWARTARNRSGQLLRRRTQEHRSARLMIGPMDGCFFDPHLDRMQTLVEAGRSVGYW
jgi:hypothetical protein